MRVGLLSDTHIPDVTKTLPHQVKEAFSDVDLILHAGDIYNFSVLDELERLAPVLAARGDDDYLTVPDERVKETHTLNLEGVRLRLCHVMPLGLFRGWMLRSNQDPPEFQDTDVLIFGHTHKAVIDSYQGVLLVNPGSPTFPNYVARLGTVAIITIASGKAEARLVQLY